MFQGLGDSERSSSRVLRPPGGASSNIFGTDEPAYTKPQSRETANDHASEDNKAAGVTVPRDTATSQARLFGGDEEVQKTPAPYIAPDSSTPAGVLTAKAKNTQGAYNPITGEEYSDQQARAAPQPRQRQPPGGASSGLW